MRTIFIDGRFLIQPISGVQRYAQEIVLALDRVLARKQDMPLVRLLTPPGARRLELNAIAQTEVGRHTGHLWTQWDFARAAKGGVALHLAASGAIAHRRVIVVIHDAAVFRHAELFSRNYVRLHRVMGRILARSAQLATVSHFSARELSSVLGVPRDRILVAHNGADHLQIAADETIVDRLGLSSTPFFLVLGNITPNKNLAVAIRAIERLAGTDAKLVAVGRLEEHVFGQGALPPKGDNVILAGRLDDDEVAGLMAQARALIFPSLYEGFGIPPLEAMSNDCPVLASTAEAVREVCGDAVDYFAPHDDRSLADLMAKALSDEDNWRAKRIDAGRARIDLFQWRASAEKLLAACLRQAD
jgi:glycosyltransferase involved in cell wall biosynthesis